MTKAHSTKKALLMSALSLLLCFAMFAGTTYAWFTDSVTSAGNKIQAGTLKIDLRHEMDGTWVSLKEEEDHKIFDYDLWEPGYIRVETLKAINLGSLALQYRLSIERDASTAILGLNGEDLADVIDVYITADNVDTTDRTTVTGWTYKGTLTEVMANPATFAGGKLLPKNDANTDDENDYTIALVMRESAGNEYQGLSVGSIFVNLIATQVDYEKDSFDDKYDAGLPFPVVSAPAAAPAPGQSSYADLPVNANDAGIVIPGELVDTLVNGASAPESFALSYALRDSVAGSNELHFDYFDLVDQDGNVIDLSANTVDIPVKIPVGDTFDVGQVVVVYHDGEAIASAEVAADKTISYVTKHFCEVVVSTGDGSVDSPIELGAAIAGGGEITMGSGYNTQDAPIAETIVIDKEVILNPNGMYLVSSAPATFTVVEGGKLIITEGAFTVKNTAANGACILVDGGEFEMAGGSFDGYTAVRTTAGKSSTVTLSAGWSNRVTVGFELNGNDTLNVTGGTLISSKQSIISNGDLTLNISGGTLSGKSPYTYNSSIVCNGKTVVNMTGGKVEVTSGESGVFSVYNDSVINISGNAVVAGTFCGVNTGGLMRPNGDNNKINISGNAKITASGAGNSFGIGYAVYACSTNTDVVVSGDAYIQGTSYGVYAGQDGSSVTISDRATIKAPGSRASGYGVGAPEITITGGTIEAKEYAVISNMEGSVVVIDNSVTGTPITISGGISDVYIHSTTDYTQNGDPNFDTIIR